MGDRGERKATKYLKKRKYLILEKNLDNVAGEIDIVAQDSDGVICFIEVKTRENLKYGYPAESVTKERQRRYRNSATYYLLQKGLTDKVCRFDVIELLKGKINHIIDAF